MRLACASHAPRAAYSPASLPSPPPPSSGAALGTSGLTTATTQHHGHAGFIVCTSTMRGITTTAVALLAAAQNTAVCAPGLHIVVARGTGEPQGAGVTGLLADRIAAQVQGSAVAPLDYPATFTDPNYDASVAAGTKAMQAALDNYTAACPGAKVAVMGYSQGAHLSMDAICGGAGDGFDTAAPLAVSEVDGNVVAIVLFGDPTHRANTTYDRGTSIKNGVFQRSNASVAACTRYADRLVSYCDTGDVYFDAGQDKKVHSSYVQKYGDDIVEYVVAKYSGAGNATATTPASAASGSATASGTRAAPTTAAAATAAAAAAAASGRVVGGLYLGVPLAMLAIFQAL
ncbi:Acetylxylan esterase 2 [Tolypocladium ophioglossoides CBS 100239]|uniref:Acetylxylan esterase 2 n=1 Tax=Tolypocladium ophioglossoides (strain CBS 100239) TaxID=1163406 RepID=A0A0L0N076_TOLOC|nr:Acetylxylan esterase 2 [Tolypocladium ophioglossoides CBS 100239]